MANLKSIKGKEWAHRNKLSPEEQQQELKRRGIDIQSLKERYAKDKKPIPFNFRKVVQQVFGEFR